MDRLRRGPGLRPAPGDRAPGRHGAGHRAGGAGARAPAAWSPSRPRPSTAWAAIATDERAVGRDLRGQGPAALQPADRPRPGPRRGRALARLERARRAPRGPVLAGRPDPDPAARAGLPAVAAGQRRRRHGRPAGARASGRARPARGDRRCRSRRRAPTRPAASARPRAGHVAQGLGDRVDLILDGGRCPIGIESTVLDLSEASRACCARAASPAPRSRPSSGRSRPAPAIRARRRAARASSPATTHPRGRCGWTRARSPPTRRCSPSGRSRSQAGGGHAQPQREGRPRGGGRQPVLDAAPAGPAGVSRDRGHADPGRRARRGDPRPPGAGRRAAAAAIPAVADLSATSAD